MDEEQKKDAGLLTPPFPTHRNRSNSENKKESSFKNSPLIPSTITGELGNSKHRGIHFADESSKPLQTEIGTQNNPPLTHDGNWKEIPENSNDNKELKDSSVDKDLTVYTNFHTSSYPKLKEEDETIRTRLLQSISSKNSPTNENSSPTHSTLGNTMKSPIKLEKKTIHFSNDVLVTDGEMRSSHQKLNDKLENPGENTLAIPTPSSPAKIMNRASFSKLTENVDYNSAAPSSDTNQPDFSTNETPNSLDNDAYTNINHPGMRKRPGSINSRASSENSDDEPLDEEDKNFLIKASEKFEILWQSPFVRQIRFYCSGYRFNVVVTFSIFLIITVFIFCSTMMMPGILLRSIDVYDVAHKGAKVSEIQSGYLSSKAPGGRLRQFVFFISVVLAVLLSFLSLDYQWEPAETLFMTGKCIPATYPTTSPLYTNLGDYMQGEVDFALVYEFGIPLEDGLIGGWSSWPMVNPYSLFSMDGSGFAYAIFTSCGYPYPAYNATGNFTKVWLTQSKKSRNILEGKVTIFLPNISIQSDVDLGYGVFQDCNFITKYGKGDIRMSFAADEWEMVTISGIKEIKVGTSSIKARESSGRTFIEFFDQLQDDVYDLTSRYQTVLQYVYNGQEFEPSQGALFSNVLAEGTLPDGYYHEDEMWKGVAVALAVPAHYVLMQFDSSRTTECDYYGEVGAGVFNVPSIWMTTIQVLLIILMGVCSMNVWWMYLMFEIDLATDVAYVSMSTKMGMAAALAKESSTIFEGYSPTTESLHADLTKKLANVKVFFGVDIDTLGNEVKEVKYSQKHKIIYLKKHFKREEKRLKLESKLRRKTSLKDKNEKSKAVDQNSDTEKENAKDQSPTPFKGGRRTSAAFEKKTFVRENSNGHGAIIQTSVMSPTLSTPATPKSTFPNPRLAAVKEDGNRSGGSISIDEE